MLTGKVALVTGSSQGIGKETASLLASYGAAVVICALDQQQCEQVAAEIQATHHTPTLAIACDVTDEQQVNAMIEKIAATLGPVDILINNAGAMLLKAFTETTTAQWQHLFNVNVHAPFYLCQAVVPSMKARGGGAIVNLASIWGTKGGPDRSGYIASKHATIGFSKALGEELKPYQIRVNAVCPGPVDTAMTDALGDDLNKEGWLQPIDIAYVITDLVLPKNKAVTATSIEAFGAGRPVGL